MVRKVYAQQNDNLDAIAYRYFGARNGVLEQILELNPQLAKHPILAIGTEVKLPDLQEITPNSNKIMVQLWD